MGDFREVTPGGKPLKRVYVAIMLWFVGRAIQAAAVVDDDVKKEFENLPDGPTMIVGKNRRGKVKYLGWNPKGRLIDLKMKIKNLEAAILLPYGLEYNRHKNGHLTAELLLPLTGVDVYTKTPRDGRMDEVIARVRQLNQDLHEAAGGRHPRCFKEVVDKNGVAMVPHEKFKDIARTVLGDGSVFYNSEELDYDDSLMVLEAAWEGRPLDTSRIKKG